MSEIRFTRGMQEALWNASPEYRMRSRRFSRHPLDRLAVWWLSR